MKNKYIRKEMIVLVALLFFILPVSSLGDLGRFEQGECVTIAQTCTSCSYVNISSISNKGNFTLVNNVAMSSFGNGEWRYEFCDTLLLGRYDIKGKGDIDSVDDSFTITFEITPSGEGGMEYIALLIFIMVLLYGINLLGFFNENVMMTVLSGMALIVFGLFMIKNGIIIYRDDLTNYVAYVTIAWGAMSSMFAIFKEYFD